MEYQVLYRKYRPHDFDSLVGQEYTKKLLKNSVKSGKFAHAYIFTGPRGTGKTSSAKIFAKAINCLTGIKIVEFFLSLPITVREILASGTL